MITTTQLNPIGRGPNTVTVGIYQDTGVINATSAFQEYLSYQKSEVSAVGTNVAVAGLGNATGTSFSAPPVTGVLAGLVVQYPKVEIALSSIMNTMETTAWNAIQNIR